MAKLTLRGVSTPGGAVRPVAILFAALFVGCGTEAAPETGVPEGQVPAAAAGAAQGEEAGETPADGNSADVATSPGDAVAQAAEPAGPATETAGQDAVGVETPPAGQTQPPTVSLDSLSARLSAAVRSQERLIARMDSIARADSVSPGPATLDLQEAGQEVRGFGLRIFWSLVVVGVFALLIRGLVWMLEALAERSVRRRLTFKSLVPIVRMFLWAMAVFIILSTVFRVDAQGILAASAALGVALGFAAQDILKNVFGGLIVVFDQPFQVGDKITVGQTYGEVVSIGLRSTRIQTAQDTLVTVPNAVIVQEEVSNTSSGRLTCQVTAECFLPGGVDEKKAKRIAFEAAVTSPYLFLEKPIRVLVSDEFREAFLTRIEVRAYVLDPRFETLFRSDVTERARDGFRAAGLVADPDIHRMLGPLPGGGGAG